MGTTITIEITETAHVPIRRHVHIPADDQVVRTWFDSQKDHSASVRQLIHDDVTAHGITDRIHRLKFGAAPVVTIKGTGNASATLPTPAAPAAPAPVAAPAAPAPVSSTSTPAWTTPFVDPRDARIAELEAQLDRIRTGLGAFAPFVDDVIDGKVSV